jgi:hypothetical protein
MAKFLRKAQQTLLIVGEGHDEVAFLKHVKSLFITRGCGLSVKIKNAQGKGAQHVVEHTVGQKKNAQYNHTAALLDTDTDWNEKVRVLAVNNDIVVLASAPCLEAMLLRVLSKSDKGSSKILKKRLHNELAGDADNENSYAKYFTKPALKETKEPCIVELLKLLRINSADR